MFNQPFSIFRARYCLVVLALAVFFPGASRAQLVVDCTGATLGAFNTISSAVGSAKPGTAIFVIAGPCNENLYLAGQQNLFIGTYYGYPNVAINGSITVGLSHGVYFRGLDVSSGTSSSADGFNVSQSQAVTIDNCTSTANGGVGLVYGWAARPRPWSSLPHHLTTTIREASMCSATRSLN